MAAQLITTSSGIQVILPYMEKGSLVESLTEATKDIGKALWASHKETILRDDLFMKMCAEEVAKEIWRLNKEKIMAEMDLKGLSSLIAVFGAKELAK